MRIRPILWRNALKVERQRNALPASESTILGLLILRAALLRTNVLAYGSLPNGQEENVRMQEATPLVCSILSGREVA